MLARRIFGAFFISLALLLGQQAAVRHDLVHAGETKHVCDQCFLGAQLSGAVAVAIATPPVVIAGFVPAVPSAQDVHVPELHLPFRSRAPPAVL